MARTATMPLPPMATPTPMQPRNGQQEAAPFILDFLASQRRLLREAPDAETALRWQLEGALAHIAALDAMLSTLQAQLWEVGHPAPPPRTPPLRPQVRALLRDSAGPMTALQIQAALETVGSMVGRLNDMVKDKQLTCTEGHYALAAAPAPAIPQAPAPRAKASRSVRPA